MSTAQYAEFARSLEATQAQAKALMVQVRDAAAYLVKHHRYSLTVIAQVADLHKNSILRLNDPTWFPKPDTLLKLEKIIERASAKRFGETFDGENIKRGPPYGNTRKMRREAASPSKKAKRVNGKKSAAKKKKLAKRGLR
jgi:hypothetical protein